MHLFNFHPLNRFDRIHSATRDHKHSILTHFFRFPKYSAFSAIISQTRCWIKNEFFGEFRNKLQWSEFDGVSSLDSMISMISPAIPEIRCILADLHPHKICYEIPRVESCIIIINKIVERWKRRSRWKCPRIFIFVWFIWNCS